MHRSLIHCATVVALALALCGCEALLPGAPGDDEILDGPIAGLSRAQMGRFVAGDEEFGRRHTFSGGLGPMFSAPSCDSCHPGDGRAHPELGFVRFGRVREDGSFDPMVEQGGPQLQDRAAPGYAPERLPAEATGVSGFLAPPVTGLGLLEAVDDETLLALEDPEDEDGDGISGRVHRVAATERIRELASHGDGGGGARMVEHAWGFVGRFGRKGSNVNLLHQAVMAYHQDMGLTSDFSGGDLVNAEVGATGSDDAADPEVGSGALFSVAFYLRTLRPPVQRGAGDAAVVEGEAIFEEAGCAACHVPSLTTGRSDVTALDRVEVRAFTDLLLHDMGEALNDGYGEGDAAPGEWRTPPLWGLGLAADFQGGELFLMHDGRARSLREAIALHGGEAESSREAFERLGAAEQGRVLRFLESL